MIRLRDVYDVLGLPSGLRLHMARTVAIVQLVAGDDSGELRRVKRDVELAMALHDVGNVVKIRLSDDSGLRMLDEAVDTVDRWRLQRAYARSRYGDDDHRATTTMLSELGVRAELIQLVERKSSRNLPSALRRGSPAELLAIYADMRVDPTGVVSIEERDREARERYRGTDRRGLGGTVTLAELQALESRIAALASRDVAAISPSEVARAVPPCLEMEIGDAFAAA